MAEITGIMLSVLSVTGMKEMVVKLRDFPNPRHLYSFGDKAICSDDDNSKGVNSL